MKKRMLSLALLVLLTLSLSTPAFAGGNEVWGDFDVSRSNNGTYRLIGYHGSGGDITIPYGVQEIWSVFSSNTSTTSITSVVIPDSVTKIASNSFAGFTNLKSVTIPDSVTEIEAGAFEGCTSLTSITIPYGVTELKDTFKNCTSLTDVTILGDVTTFKD